MLRTPYQRLVALAALGTLGASSPAFAQAAPTLDKGDTAWMLVSTVLVMLMIIPGLALFYGGLVKKENLLATLMQTFITCCVVTLMWTVADYSLAFNTNGTMFLGGFDNLMLQAVGVDSMVGTIPESVFVTFQMTFAIITSALILGAVADRIKFSATVLFVGLWVLFVYAPVAHWVWGGGILASDQSPFTAFGTTLDFAGGTVVNINAGIAGLVAAIVLGRRSEHEHGAIVPHNLAYSLMGASLLWVGWFGFNAGSALTAGASAGMAMLVTQIATATAALAWMLVDWVAKGKPSVFGTICGAVAGLVAITPAAGFVGVGGALAIGLFAGVLCFWAASSLKDKFGVDDSLDVFSVHGVGGIVGAILTGVFAESAIGGKSGLLEGNGAQVIAQCIGVGVTVVYSGLMTFAILKVVGIITGLRVDEQTERDSLDMGLHGERIA